MFETEERKNRRRIYQFEHRPAWEKVLTKISKLILAIILVPCGIFALLDPRMWLMIAGLILIEPLINKKY